MHTITCSKTSCHTQIMSQWVQWWQLHAWHLTHRRLFAWGISMCISTACSVLCKNPFTCCMCPIIPGSFPIFVCQRNISRQTLRSRACHFQSRPQIHGQLILQDVIRKCLPIVKVKTFIVLSWAHCTLMPSAVTWSGYVPSVAMIATTW